jgi:hypothetical protein
MSHVATCDLHITNLDALREACEELGLELVLNQRTFKWYGRFMGDYNGADAAFSHGIKPEDYGKCVHAIRVKGNPQAYEIGLVPRPDGKPGYQPVFDFWGEGQGQALVAVVGKGCERLKDHYGAAVACRIYKAKGYHVSKQIVNGAVHFQASKN